MMSKFRAVSLLCVISIFAASGLAWPAPAAKPAETGKAPAAAAQNKNPGNLIDKRALDILKRMSDTITQTSSLSFKSKSMVPTKGPRGIWVNLLGVSRVVKQGSDKLFAEMRGDFFPYDFYFDGKAVTRYAPTTNVYSVKESPGTVGELIESSYREDGKSFPFADMLVDNPYEVLTGDMINALYVGQTTIGDVKTDHLAFVNKDVEWQVWIGCDDYLPRYVNATYLDDVSEPSYAIEFFEWKINESVPASTFIFNNASKAAKVDFRNPK